MSSSSTTSPTPLPRILDGKAFAATWMQTLAQEHQAWSHANNGAVAGLAVVQVGNDAASSIYVNRKAKTAKQLGFYTEQHTLAEHTTQNELEALLRHLNQQPTIHGILVQLPLPSHLSTQRVQTLVLPEKDADGFHPTNAGLLALGLPPLAVPCTPAGIMRLLQAHGVDVAGKHAVVLGRSNIVGKPMAQLLLQANATVTLCHSKTHALKEHLQQADILVAAVGMPHFVTAEMVKPGAVVVDVGINRLDTGRLVGDVDFEAVAPRCSAITPVPGGVGPLTIAQLMQNTFSLAQGSLARTLTEL
ncbi:MAG: bifunctional 5,10-methylenetetrahydrofolate dehydrogenase/5,10-methenyltetrahydrofolate cyclohydrolase [Vampirovibrionales bacterium]